MYMGHSPSVQTTVLYVRKVGCDVGGNTLDLRYFIPTSSDIGPPQAFSR